MSLSAMSTCLLNISRHGDSTYSTASLGNLVQGLMTLSVKRFFPISSLNLPSYNLRPFPLVLLLVEEVDPPPGYSLLSGICRKREVSPEPSFLQAKHSWLPQMLLTGLMLHTLHKLCCPVSTARCHSKLPAPWPSLAPSQHPTSSISKNQTFGWINLQLWHSR